MILLALLVLVASCGFTAIRADRNRVSAETSHPPLGTLLDVNGMQVHAVTRGSGPDLLLIHGASGNLRDFTFDLMNRLTDDYRVTAIDRPGLGYTDRLENRAGRGETPYEQASLLHAAATQLGLQQPIVLGQSFGGAVALAYAIKHPEALSGLVIVAGASNLWEGGLGPEYWVTASRIGGAVVVPLVSAFAPRDKIAGAVEGIFAPDPVPAGYSDYIGIGLTLRRNSLDANAQQVNGLKPHLGAMIAQYGKISVPTEIIHGDTDTIVPLDVHSIPLSTQIPEANLTVLPGAGHMPHHTHPDQVVAAIDRAAKRAGLHQGAGP